MSLLSTSISKPLQRVFEKAFLRQVSVKNFQSLQALHSCNQCHQNKIDCMHTRWIHSSGLLLVPDDSSKFSQSASKLNDNGSDSKVKLDHMEKLTHFRDNIKSQTTEKQQSSGTSDLAGVNTDVHPDVLEARSMQEGGYRLPHPIWTEDEVSSVKITHRPPVTKVDKLAFYTVKCMRSGFDLLSGYTFGNWRGRLDEKQWIKRIIFLETVAGVPGMVGAMVRHLISLRRFKRDQGWIHTLLEEAENERMHLMTAMRVGNPGIIMRSFVFVTQAVFVGGFSLAYLISPRFCHRFVGYLEEEAVKTYTLCLKEIDEGKLKMWSRMKAPEIAIEYWKLEPDAMMRDVILAIRADEAHHRAVNHTLSGMKPDEQNPFPPGE